MELIDIFAALAYVASGGAMFAFVAKRYRFLLVPAWIVAGVITLYFYRDHLAEWLAPNKVAIGEQSTPTVVEHPRLVPPQLSQPSRHPTPSSLSRQANLPIPQIPRRFQIPSCNSERAKEKIKTLLADYLKEQIDETHALYNTPLAVVNSVKIVRLIQDPSGCTVIGYGIISSQYRTGKVAIPGLPVYLSYGKNNELLARTPSGIE